MTLPETTIKARPLEDLGPYYMEREKILLEYARDRVVAGFSLVVHREGGEDGKPGVFVELYRDKDGSYVVTTWKNGNPFKNESCPAKVARFLVRNGIRWSVLVDTEPPIGNGREERLEQELAATLALRTEDS